MVKPILALVSITLSFSETGAGPPLVILHGLFGSKRNWASVAGRLGQHHRVLTADLRNHGARPWADQHDYPALADDVADLIRAEIGGAADVLGHSMGGKAAMILALTQPQLVRRLVVVDIPPAASPQTAIAPLRSMQGVPLTTLTRSAEVEAALAASIPEPAVRGFLALNATTGPDGLAWSVNLAAIEQNFELISGFPTIPPGRAFTGPTLFIAGEKSGYLQPQHQAEIDRLFPASTIEIIPGAGHWVHAEAPRLFQEAVSRFLTA